MSYVFSSIEADRLGEMALGAATQLDRMKRNQASDLGRIGAFALAVAQFAGIDHDTHQNARYLDPSSSEILSGAVQQAFDKGINDVDALNEELLEIVGRLKNTDDDNKNGIERMERFCLSIHALILKSRASVGIHERGAFDYEYSYTG